MTIRLGGWFPWNEHRQSRHLQVPPNYRHGWLYLTIGRFHLHLSWDHLPKDRPSVDYDAVP